MFKKLLASTAVATLIAGGAYAQNNESAAPQTQQEQQQDRVASAHGQEIMVEDGDTVMLDSKDIEFTIRLNSGGTSAVPGQNMAADSDATEAPASATEQTAADTEASTDAQDQTAANTTETADRVAASDSNDEKRVSHGDILVINSENDSFSLNFEVSEANEMAAADADNASTATTAADADNASTAPAATGTDNTTTAAIDRGSLQARGLDQIRADELIGSNIYGADEANIGSIGDVILTQDGQVDALIVDVGGFLGIGSREVAVGLDNIEFMVDDNNKWYVYTPFTEEQLKNQPEYNADTYANERDQQRLIVR